MADQHEPAAPTGQAGAEPDDAAAAAARLERALERIAAAAQGVPVAGSGEGALAREVAGRLDAIIEQVRAALAAP